MNIGKNDFTSTKPFHIISNQHQMNPSGDNQVLGNYEIPMNVNLFRLIFHYNNAAQYYVCGFIGEYDEKMKPLLLQSGQIKKITRCYWELPVLIPWWKEQISRKSFRFYSILCAIFIQANLNKLCSLHIFQFYLANDTNFFFLALFQAGFVCFYHTYKVSP